MVGLLQSAGLLEPRREELGGEMSCAEMAAANLQSLTINSRIASEAADFLARLLITNDLKRFGWKVNLAAGSAKSHYTTPEAVAHLIRQPVNLCARQARLRNLRSLIRQRTRKGNGPRSRGCWG